MERARKTAKGALGLNIAGIVIGVIAITAVVVLQFIFPDLYHYYIGY